MTRTIVLPTLLACLLAHPAVAIAAPCDDAALHRILAPIEGDDDTAVVDCDLELSPLMAAAITRSLSFVGAASSGITVDCDGGAIGSDDAPARLVFTSRRIGSSAIDGLGIWEPVTDVTVRDCEIHGRVLIRGMGTGGWNDEVTRSSHIPLGHVQRVREAAPRRITFDGVTFVGVGGIPIYVAIGVEETSVVRSSFIGWALKAAIYLDAESRGATIRDNTFDVSTSREIIALDGSSENRIIGNRFSRLEHGGIYFYRNCGERTTVRITPPQDNEVIDNIFYYNRYEGPNPAVFFGSDNGYSTHRFCYRDLDYPYGSGLDDRDYARWNVVLHNQVVGRSPDDVFHTEWPAANTPNHVEANESVVSAVSRPAGCHAPGARDTRFLAHGASTEVVSDRDGRPYEAPVEVSCFDGDLAYASAPQLRAVREVPFSCSQSHDNAGCDGVVRCPDESTLVGAHAACNLEHGPVTDDALASVPRDTLRVVRASDIARQGRCWIGTEGGAAGEVPLARALRGGAEMFGCREHDRNGGDCEIRGVAYCVDP
ncbi:Hypothetical protein I5071_87390 [Sandaracinus amylolyticus]|nr:Hypothetical protein I5071_87390 [Sandaracinus amylolyticus]